MHRLSHPDEDELQKLIDGGEFNLSYQDIAGKNFLDNSKLGVYNTTIIADRLIDTFSSSVLEKNDLELVKMLVEKGFAAKCLLKR